MIEEITDIITDEAYQDKNFKKGILLKFKDASLVITKVDRKNKRVWARHTKLIKSNIGLSHYGHNLDATKEVLDKYNVPFCTDCEVPLDLEANQAGKTKYADRKKRTLEDGTEIPDEIES